MYSSLCRTAQASLAATLTVVFLSLALTSSAWAVEDVLIKTRDGATVSAMVELPQGSQRVAAILAFDIYTNPDELKKQAQSFAARGYAGVVADVRGKRLSPDEITPYEHDARDTHEVIDWIARQSWSNGKVGMVGGSYSGFTAWAATKHKHEALRGIAVSAAAIPGLGLPMYNNVFLSANYAWAFFVANDKLLDHALYDDRARWSKLTRNWFMSGRPYREIDAIDGTPNPWLQRWLQHPSYDAYWQAMVPYGTDFASIDIPVLSITGYYDDGQISALQYFKEHIEHRPNAEHYLVVGPYDHFGTHAAEKPAILREYTLDKVALIDSQDLKLAFMDYVLKGAPKPKLLNDRVNFQTMGANEWRHRPSLRAMHAKSARLYFSSEAREGVYSLVPTRPSKQEPVLQKVDLADRVRFHGFHAYPNPIVQGPLSYVTETIYGTEPFDTARTVSGAFRGELAVTVNKKDFDYSVTVYEAMPDGRLFHLGYALHRASYARDLTQRKLLEPGKPANLPFETTLVSRRMEPGSRLMVLLDVNKHPMAQINYGTGKDVSDESVKDAGSPLEISWRNRSYIDVPLDQ